MKKSTLALALGTAALFIGCGGGGGSGGGDTNSSSSISSSSSSDSSSSISSSSSSAGQISQLAPITTKLACDPAKSPNPPYTDLKYNAEGGEIVIGCLPDKSDIIVSLKDGSAEIALKKVHIEEFDNKYGMLNTKTYYDYTANAFVITYFHGRDITGNLVQESCTRTYNPSDLSAMDPDSIQLLLNSPAMGNLAGETGTTCDKNIITFGDRIDNPDQGNSLIQRNYTFTPVIGDDTKVYREERASYGNGGGTKGATSLTVSKPADVMGYRLTSIEVTDISKDTIVVEFGCDGSFTQKWTKQYEGLDPDTSKITGSEVYIESVTGLADNPLTRIRWANGTDKFGQSVNDGAIYLMGDNSQLLTNQSCFNDNCDMGFYLKSIEKISACN